MLSYLPVALGLPVLVLPVVAAVRPRSRERVLGLVALAYLFLGLCLTSVFWINTIADASTVLDTVNGWLFGAVFLMVWATLLAAVAIARSRGRAR